MAVVMSRADLTYDLPRPICRRYTLLMSDALLSLVRGRRGHFLYESGHHGDMWFDLETLFLRPAAVQPHIAKLATVIARHEPQVVCGPLVEGAYVGLLVAQELGCEFVYANRESTADSLRSTEAEKPSTADRRQSTLFPIEYRIPAALHSAVKGKRVAIANDMINAGSAVRGAYLHLKELGAEVPVVASLMLCGEGFKPFASENQLKVESLAQFPSHLWTPAQCPLCRNGEKLEELAKA